MGGKGIRNKKRQLSLKNVDGRSAAQVAYFQQVILGCTLNGIRGYAPGVCPLGKSG
jgi:hypothetical protein